MKHCRECNWAGPEQDLVKGECFDDDKGCPACFGTNIEEAPPPGDIHTETAACLFELPLDRVSPEQKEFARELREEYGPKNPAQVSNLEAIYFISEMERHGARIDTEKLEAWSVKNLCAKTGIPEEALNSGRERTTTGEDEKGDA